MNEPLNRDQTVAPLARSGITEDFRREMEGYRSDIAEGAFADADLKYLIALDLRLSGKC